MTPDDQTAWVTLKIELPDDLERALKELAQHAGISIECYCVRVLLNHLMETASRENRERWQSQIPATLRRNGCDDAITRDLAVP
jgi:hypothetical protein